MFELHQSRNTVMLDIFKLVLIGKGASIRTFEHSSHRGGKEDVTEELYRFSIKTIKRYIQYRDLTQKS